MVILEAVLAVLLIAANIAVYKIRKKEEQQRIDAAFRQRGLELEEQLRNREAPDRKPPF